LASSASRVSAPAAGARGTPRERLGQRRWCPRLLRGSGLESGAVRAVCGLRGPRIRSSPRARIWPRTAATCPCGRERTIVRASPAGMKASPASARRTSSIIGSGKWDRFARVWCLTLLPSRYVQRSGDCPGRC
jgi:hypothetical protein